MWHDRGSGLKERRRLTVNVYMIKMEPGENPRKFLLRVYPELKELERMERTVDPKAGDAVLLSVLTSPYDAEVPILECSSDWPTREWTKVLLSTGTIACSPSNPRRGVRLC